jgi:hypothetical protein
MQGTLSDHDWGTFASLGAPLCPHLKMLTLQRLQRCGFVFHIPLRKQAFDGSRKTKPRSYERGYRFK